MSGTLQASVVKDSASATNNLALDASGNVTVGNNLTVNGTSTHTGNATFAGTITGSSTIAASTGTLYPIVSGTSQASTSGTSITFTSIPSWVKRITVMFNGVSTSGTSSWLVQIGSGSVSNSGYSSVSGYVGTGSTAGSVNSTSGFVIGIGNAASLAYGSMVLTLFGSNTWVSSTSLGDVVSGSYYGFNGGGVSPALSGALDRVVITTANGTDTFDAGSINILYE